MEALLAEVRSCRVCVEHLPRGPRPVLRAHSEARILVAGQAPGTRVHETGIPWNDPSGVRLREWMGVAPDTFYDETRIAIVPMGFCYPGRGKGGDLPPRKECAALFMERLLAALPKLELILPIGAYAQAYHLGARRGATLTETVRAFRDYAPRYLPLPHPSPRNNLWLGRNPWFAEAVVPALRRRCGAVLGDSLQTSASSSATTSCSVEKGIKASP
ncbi:MAG: uracil-DNA glycosylase family protein [Myxococcales bacterium]|nr:uracil-DNA glycosylase family protein [Myxococcales bacterium]